MVLDVKFTVIYFGNRGNFPQNFHTPKLRNLRTEYASKIADTYRTYADIRKISEES